jgi:hypothetical protein
MTSTGRRSGSLLLVLIGVSLAGAADVAEFLVTRSAMFTDAPGRAAGSAVGLALWLALLGVATLRQVRGERPGSRAVTIGLAGLVAAGNLGLTAIHLKAGVGGLRPAVGGVLGILALVLALAQRGVDQGRIGGLPSGVGSQTARFQEDERHAGL